MTSHEALATAFRPPLTPNRFVNRRHELRIVSEWLEDERVRLVAITGSAGIGKTALAARVAEQVSSRGWTIVWVAADQVGGRANLPGHSPVWDLLRESISRHAEMRLLLVLDDQQDVETVHAASALIKGTKSRLLVTSRDSRLGEMGRSINLTGLTYQDTLILLRRLAPTLPVQDGARVA